MRPLEAAAGNPPPRPASHSFLVSRGQAGQFGENASREPQQFKTIWFFRTSRTSTKRLLMSLLCVTNSSLKLKENRTKNRGNSSPQTSFVIDIDTAYAVSITSFLPFPAAVPFLDSFYPPTGIVIANTKTVLLCLVIRNVFYQNLIDRKMPRLETILCSRIPATCLVFL